jgi:ATP-dependent DNA helicase DinG
VTSSTQPGSLGAAARSALGEHGPFAARVDGYRVREGQLELASAIGDAIDTRSTLIAEAGTGTGKTFAYLTPALLSGARVVVSTGTRTLQDQLFERDLPEVMRALGVHAQCAVLKGRANYVCRYHLRHNLADGRFARREDIVDLRRIDRFAAISPTGDRSAAPGVSEDAPAWALATSTRENCLGQECPDLGDCFVVKARQAAQQADLVVVNHHLFCADLALRDEGIADLLPTADALIFDEAHQLPEVATGFFGLSVSTRKLVEFARDAMRAGHAEARDAADWMSLASALEQAVRDLRLAGGPPARLDAQAVRSNPALLEAVETCCACVVALRDVLRASAERGREVARCAMRALELKAAIRRWQCAVDPGLVSPRELAAGSDTLASVVADPDSAAPVGVEVEDTAGDGIRIPWVEIGAGGLSLHATPLSVADTFVRHRAQRPRAWIFVSATLSMGGDFGHFTRAIGMEDARTQAWESPFDFAHHGLLYVPAGIGPPSGVDFARRVEQAIWPLVEANRGRAFVLCTTLRMVEQLARGLAARIENDAGELELLVQGTASRAELLERFRRATAPILVGSASFWEGVDVRGRQLSLVVIDKLPFAPPEDPVLRARIEAVRRAGGDPFRELQMPGAALALKQGAGRMIRSESDRGLLVVCDERLAERPYGRRLLRSLPPFARTRSERDALDFLARLDGAPELSATPATSDDPPA